MTVRLAEPTGVGWPGMSLAIREWLCYDSHSGEDGINIIVLKAPKGNQNLS